MKPSHSLYVLAIAFCAAQSPAMAQTQTPDGWYAGGSLGSSSIKLRTENISQTLSGQQDTRDTGYKVYGGYQFHSNWAAELQYFNLGKYRYTESGSGGDSITVKTHGLAISAVGMWPVTQQLTLLGKLGLARQTFSAEAVAGTEQLSRRVSKGAPLVGIGAEYQIDKNLRLRAEYEYFGMPTVLSSGDQAIKLRTDLLSVGLRYRF